MVNRQTCPHLSTVTSLPIKTILNSKEYLNPLKCDDCDYAGPNLWLCLFKNCLRLGCSEKAMDHSTIHNSANPSHSVHMNILTKRMWCYQCSREVFMDVNMNESDHECENGPIRADSGCSSYDSMQPNCPDRANIFENSVGLNVGMSGDGDVQDSSDNEEEYNSTTSQPAGLVGLQNIGNTCYMNSALQALSNTEPLTRFFLDCPYIVQLLSEGRKPGLSRTYQVLMRDIWLKKGGHNYVTPSGILYGIRSVHPMFRGFHQHDTQEFLRNFMDQLHEELKQPAPPDHTPAVIAAAGDPESLSSARDEPASGGPPSVTAPSSGYDSSEGEYETCDSGVSERSSLSDDGERPASVGAAQKRRLSRCGSPNRRQRQRVQSASVIDAQPGTSGGVTQKNKKQVKYRSIISDIFDGKVLSSVQCLTCDRVSSRVETFQDLSLPIPSRDHLALLHGRTAAAASVPGPAAMAAACADAVLPIQDGWLSWILAWLRSWFYGPTVTLHDCLAAFFSTDELKGDNMYSCEKCNKLRNGVKFSKVLQLPEVLCVHLKRFRHELMFSSKISAAVSFPLKGLDMRPYLHGDCVSKVSTYDLFSVICHHGTAGGGHYTSFALNSGKWYEFDDQYVSRVEPDKVQSCEAYVLFYRKSQTSADNVRHKVSSMLDPQKDDIKRTYISKQWLNRFYNCAEPGPIDNSDFLCQHGAVNPDRDLHLEHLTCVVPLDVYEFLHEKFGGATALPNLQICPTCSELSKRLLMEMETFVEVSKEAQNHELPHTHYLSTSWYTQWHNFVQKINSEPPGPIDNTKINPNNPDVNEAAEVPECIWKFFYEIYGGGPELRVKPMSVQKAESEESIPSTCEEMPEYSAPLNNKTESKNEENSSNFVIPTLKSRRETPKVDKRFYCSGEPMETESIPICLEDNVMETDELRPSEGVTNELLPENFAEEKNATSSNIDDDIDEAESEEILNRRQRRRRRRNWVGA